MKKTESQKKLDKLIREYNKKIMPEKTEAQKIMEKAEREFNKKINPKKTEQEIRAQKVLKDAEIRMKRRSDAYDTKSSID